MKRILMLPFAGLGCIIPTLEFAKRLSVSHHITLAVQANFATVVEERLVRSPLHNITLHVMDAIDIGPPTPSPYNNNQPFPFNTNRDQGAAAIRKLLKETFTAFCACTGEWVKNEHATYDVIICDVFWGIESVRFAASHSIPVYYFCTGNAGQLLMMVAVQDDTPATNVQSDKFFWKVPAEGEKTLDYVPGTFKDTLLEGKRGLPYVRGVICNSTREIDTTYLRRLETYDETKGVKTWFPGPLLPDSNTQENDPEPVVEEVTNWLDKQPKHSVVYFSFGSHIPTKPDQAKEILSALLSLTKPFIWSLNTASFDGLPEEYRVDMRRHPELISGMKYLILSWTPQTVILGHEATAVFVSHCGWNSTLEALTMGVPVVGWPFVTDQKADAELLESIGMGVVLQGTGFHAQRTISAEEIAENVKIVAGWVGESGISTNRQAAQKWKSVIAEARKPEGSSQRDLINFMQDLKLL